MILKQRVKVVPRLNTQNDLKVCIHFTQPIEYRNYTQIEN